MGADATNVIYASGAHSNIPSTNMYVAPQTKEGLKFHHHIILEDGTEGYKKYVREKEGLFLTDTTWRNAHQSLLTIRVITQEITNAADFTNLSLRYAFTKRFGVVQPSTFSRPSCTNFPGDVSKH